MAINFTDFSRAPIQESPLANLWENAFKGYQIGRAPQQMNEEAEQRQLANKLKQLEFDQNPEKFDVEMKYKKALTEAALAKMNNTKNGVGAKLSGDVNNADIIWKMEHPEGDTTPELQKQHLEYIKAPLTTKLNATETGSERRKQIMKSDAYNKSPVAFKAQQMALGAALGMDPGEVAKRLSGGETITEMAKEKGIDPKTLIPVYPTANENIKQTQIRASLVAELHSLENSLADIQGQYSRKLFGYSPKQVIEALKNENPDMQGMILAARNLAPEISAIRAKIATNGTIGIEALRELTDKSLGNLKIYEPLVSEEARNAMNKYTDQLIQQASDAYTNKMQSYSQIQAAPNQQQIVPSSNMANALTNNQPTPQKKQFDWNKYPVAGQ